MEGKIIMSRKEFQRMRVFREVRENGISRFPRPGPLKGKYIRWVEPNPDVGIPSMIRKIRTESGLSQKEVAHRLHIAYQSYQTWENSNIANPTLKQLSKLAGAVGKKLAIDMV